MISTLRQIVSLAKIPVAALVLSAFLLGQFVEVWHYHSPNQQHGGVEVAATSSQNAAVGHDSCPICSSAQFLKDVCVKPLTTLCTWLVKTTQTFLKHTLYQFLSSILRPGRAPPAL